MAAEYKYDVFGNRLQKSVDADGVGGGSAVITKFAIDGWNPAKPSPIGNENYDVLADLTNGGSLATRYLRGDSVDQLLARVDNVDSTMTPYWHLADQLGSVRDVLDGNGDLVDSLRYDRFGNIDSGTELNGAYRGRYAWTGREFDVETALQFNRARYYDIGTGRWISQDPTGFDAGDNNLYRYATNNPIQLIDPSGYEGENVQVTELGTPATINNPNLGKGIGMVSVYIGSRINPGGATEERKNTIQRAGTTITAICCSYNST